jgi:hypothetical protein
MLNKLIALKQNAGKMHDYSILGYARKVERSEARCSLLGSGMVNSL